MSQAQTQSKPPPLPEGGIPLEAYERAEDRAQFYHELHSVAGSAPVEEPEAAPEPAEPAAAPPEPEPEPRLSELAPRLTPAVARPLNVQAAYHRTGSNVLQLEPVRHDRLWHQSEPTFYPAMESRRARPRAARRIKHVAKNRYRTGHVIVTFFALMGWLLVVTGIAAALVFVFAPAVSNQVGTPNLLGGAAGALFVGLLTVAMALTGRARFDQANATQEILAMQRARAATVEPY